MQQKQSEWAWQWEHLQDDNRWLFNEWISPVTLADFKGKTVLDCGCGGGQHVFFTAPEAASVTGVDLNALESARERTKNLDNVTFVEDDIARMDLKKQFDIVYSIGVLHHTDDPTASFRNISKHAKPQGRVIVWVYSREGNFINEWILEPLKRVIIDYLPRSIVLFLSNIITAILYLPIYTVYLLPLTFLPFYEYFQNWRRLSFRRNVLNVFDKLNAPQTWFIPHSLIQDWFDDAHFTDVHISPYKGVSWRGSGTLLDTRPRRTLLEVTKSEVCQFE
jgi:SAM-dependent methyltransferase